MTAKRSPQGQPSFTGMTQDSRQVRPGYLFAALPGSQADGRDFIPAAIAAGASIILTTADYQIPADLKGKAEFILSPRPTLDLARQAAAFYPGQPKHIAGVTGTKGKSSVTHYTFDLLRACKREAGAIGTLGILPDEILNENRLTTASAIFNHQWLSTFAERGYSHAVMEVSSHGIHQDRVAAVKFTAAAFTTFTPDHLDYHQTIEAYASEKLRLFSELLPQGSTAVLNKNLEIFDRALDVCKKAGHSILVTGGENTNLFLKDEETLIYEGKSWHVGMRTLFPFQRDNLMVAMGLCLGMGAGIEELVHHLMDVRAVPGRMEPVLTLSNGAEVFVDYAHTGASFETVLKLARARTQNHVNVVFGCGGQRPRERRRDMGTLAQKLADKVYVVDADPRGEDPVAIRQEILGYCPKGQDCGKRPDGIRRALLDLEPGDILLICGKGHERTVNYNGALIPHNDRESALEIYHQLQAEGAVQ